MNKKLLYGILIVLLASLALFRYTYQNHRNISAEKASYTISVPDLEKEFATNDSLALLKFQDQTIEITAEVTAVDNEIKAIILENILFATFKDSLPQNILSCKKIRIKGRFLGYDELLEEFKMDQCSIIP